MTLARFAIPALAMALTLGACHSHRQEPPLLVVDPSPAEINARAVDTAERICAVDSLRAARDETIRSARDLVYGRRGAPDMSQERDARVRVALPASGPQSELTERLRVFETDLDAAYRFASTACQAYAMCMHARDYDDRACEGVRGSWDAAQTRFIDASSDLGLLRADMSDASYLPPGPPYPLSGDGDHRGRGERDGERGCDPRLSAVFTSRGC